MAKEFTGATHNDLPQMMELLTEQVFKLNEKVDKLNASKLEYEAPINTKELCKRLQITEQTAIAWRKKGKIPFMQLNGVRM